MKKTLFLVCLSLIAMVACNNKASNTSDAKVSENDVKKAEESLFNEDMSTNSEAVSDAIATFSKYAEDNPDAEDAPEYLFKAMEVSINTKQDPQQSIGLCGRLLEAYPKFDKNPVALFMLATFVYDEQLHDLDKARAAYQRIVDEYPESAFADDAAISIEQLGMSPDELVRMFESQENSED